MTDVRKNKPAGIREVAERSGVSVATVSLAFSRKRPVSAKVRKRVMEAAKELRYEPNQWARNLLAGRTKMIGLLTDRLGNPFSAEWAMLLEEEARQRGYRTWVAFTGGNKERAEECLAEFRRHRMDGIIVGSGAVGDKQIRSLAEMNMSVVTPDRTVDGLRCTPVEVDFADGIRQVVSYLHGLGHRRTAFVGSASAGKSSDWRLDAYRQVVVELGMELNEDLIVEIDESVQLHLEQLEPIIVKDGRYTAVVCYNDNTAFGAIRALHAHGLRVPEDVSVTGFDDVAWCELWQPRLTSVGTDMRRRAQLTMDRLIDRIENGTEMEPEAIRPQLVIRDSCAPARV